MRARVEAPTDFLATEIKPLVEIPLTKQVQKILNYLTSSPLTKKFKIRWNIMRARVEAPNDFMATTEIKPLVEFLLT